MYSVHAYECVCMCVWPIAERSGELTKQMVICQLASNKAQIAHSRTDNYSVCECECVCVCVCARVSDGPN